MRCVVEKKQFCEIQPFNFVLFDLEAEALLLKNHSFGNTFKVEYYVKSTQYFHDFCMTKKAENHLLTITFSIVDRLLHFLDKNLNYANFLKMQYPLIYIITKMKKKNYSPQPRFEPTTSYISDWESKLDKINILSLDLR